MKMLGMVPVEKFKPNEWNAIELSAEDEAKLKQQMRVSGPEKTEPITVRRAGEHYEIINGEKRWRIAQQLGWRELPAVEIEASDYEVKKYCLSYNLLRGTVNYVKLAKLMQADEEMVKVCRELLGEAKTKQLLESGKRLTKEAEEILQEATMKGASVTPEKIQVVARPLRNTSQRSLRRPKRQPTRSSCAWCSKALRRPRKKLKRKKRKA